MLLSVKLASVIWGHRKDVESYTDNISMRSEIARTCSVNGKCDADYSIRLIYVLLIGIVNIAATI